MHLFAEPIELPTVTVAHRAGRLARTAAAFGRHLAPVRARKTLRRPLPETATMRGVKLAFDDLGATYLKLGQFVAASAALVGEEVAAEFRGCLDAGPPVPFTAVRRAVESELGRPLEEVFDSFEETPVAAASISVVHRAVLRDGQAVAVKVLRPGIEEVVATDLDTMEPMFRFLARQGMGMAAGLLQFVSGLRAQIAEELDLRNEARAMERFRQLFAEAELDLLVVPHVVAAASGRRVLTMELLEGVAVDDLDRIGELGIDPRPVIEQLLRSWYLGVVRDGVFHGDIHAGNLMMLRDGRIGVLDWGIVARLDADTHNAYRRIVEACLGDESAWLDVTNHFLRLGAGMGETVLSPEEIAPILRSQIEPMLTRPLGEVGMVMFQPPQGGADSGLPEVPVDDPFGDPFGFNEGPPKNMRERWRRRARVKKAARRLLDGSPIDTEFNLANLLTIKQIIYLEHYGKLYLPEVSLLSDELFLRRLLGHPEEPVPAAAG
ncbi:MAG TPA: AarF/ABC1/UbiB kinase family protein [Acidimicrobiales bacterium]|nr:AarF/ABC1/UbiB kinase family protein [Acidimicrobiales bacterium]